MATIAKDPILELIAEVKRNGTTLSRNPETGKLKWSGKAPTPELMAKLRASKGALIEHLATEPARAGVVGAPEKVGKFLGIPTGVAPVTGAELAMAIPQLLGPEVPEIEGLAKMLGPGAEALLEQFPKTSKLAYKAGRTGVAAGAGAILGGKKGAEIGAGSEMLGWPLEAIGPIYRAAGRGNALARETAKQTGEVVASHLENFAPELAATIRQGTSRFAEGRQGRNWASIITRAPATAEASQAYEDGMSFITKDLRNSIHGHYQQMISKLQSQSGIATPQQALAITRQIDVLQRRQRWEMDLAERILKDLKAAKVQAGNAAFKPTSELREGVRKIDLINAYNEASAKLHNYMNEMDMKYGSALTPNLDKLDNQYNSFWHLHDIASDPKLRNKRTGGLDRELLQNKLQDPESAHLEKSMRPQKWRQLQEASGLNPETSSSMIPGQLPIRFRASAANPSSAYFGIPRTRFDPTKNIPGVLNPTKLGGTAGALGKAIIKGLLIPAGLWKATEDSDASGK